MKKLLSILILTTVLSCSSNNDTPSLKIVNDFTKWVVTDVKLQDYEFNNLSIEGNESRTFLLNNGIPSGSLDIAIMMRMDCKGRNMEARTVNVDFYNGYTTTIKINLLPDTTPDSILADCYLYEYIVTYD
jgi:hypothetical protein